MRLSIFIDHAREEIIAESIAYATTIPTLKCADKATLRNHLPLVLDAISRDLEQPQSIEQSVQKSLGLAPVPSDATAAQTHGTQRARIGLNIEQVVAEYRVLRSCILRLWAQSHAPDAFTIDDTLRFNEAIDQAVAESVSFHAAEVAKWRDILLGVLGHDLRSPLNAVLLSGELLRQKTSGDAHNLAQSVLRGGRRLAVLLDSLLEYNKSSLGVEMKIQRDPGDLGSQCQEEVGLLRMAFPDRNILFTRAGDTSGSFVHSRLREALANLVSNAVQYSPRDTAVRVTVLGGKSVVEIATENVTAPLPQEELHMLFDPLRRRSTEAQRSSPNLGLGLFIVREIARAHQGEATATMANGNIQFTMVVPKFAKLAPASRWES